MSQPGIIPYRIRIGATGPRSLPRDIEALESTVRSAIEKHIPSLFDANSKKQICKAKSTPLAFSVVTALADGADRLIAEIVMNLPESSINSFYRNLTSDEGCRGREIAPPRLEPVIPLDVDDYRKTFKNDESVAQYDNLLRQVARPAILRQNPLSEDLPDGDEAAMEVARYLAFSAAGRHVVNSCDVLIAIRNSKAASGLGFTAETIEYARRRKRPVIIIDIEDASSREEAFPVFAEPGHGLNAEPIQGLDMLNRRRLTEKELDGYRKSSDPIGNADEGKRLSAAARGFVSDELLPEYARASELAAHYQSIYQYVGVLVFCFAAAAVASVALATLIHQVAVYAFVTEALLLGSVFMMVYISNRERVNRKWIESRMLAERLRSAMFFAACEAEITPVSVPTYMGIASRAGDWMMMAFDEIWQRLPRMDGCSGQSCNVMRDFINKCWLQDQIDYHRKKAVKAGKYSRRLEKAGIAVFLVAIAAPVLHLMLFNAGFHLTNPAGEKLLTFIALWLPAVGAAVGGIRSHREFSRLSKRSANMEANLRELDESFEELNDADSLRSMLYQLEQVMLFENQDWLLLMKPAKVHYVP